MSYMKLRKKSPVIIMGILLILLLLSCCDVLAAKTITMKAGDVLLLKNVDFLDKSSISTVSTSKKSVAGINKTQIFAKRPGETRITIEYKNNHIIEFNVNVEVKNILVVGHRGDIKKAPENTMAAFKEGYRTGYRAFECDVFANAQDELYMCHDPNLRRLTGVDVNIKKLKNSDIKNYPIKYGVQSASYGTQYVTRLKVLFSWLQKKPKVKIFLHIRNLKANHFTKNNAKTLASLIKKYQLTDRAVPFVSLKEKGIKSWLKGYGVNVGYIHQTAVGSDAMCKAIKEAHADGVNTIIFHTVNGEPIPLSAINKAHYYGMQIGSYTINNKSQYEKYITTPSDFIITNAPVF